MKDTVTSGTGIMQERPRYEGYVKVVTCEKCWYWTRLKNWYGICELRTEPVFKNQYCSYGERRP